MVEVVSNVGATRQGQARSNPSMELSRATTSICIVGSPLRSRVRGDLPGPNKTKSKHRVMADHDIGQHGWVPKGYAIAPTHINGWYHRNVNIKDSIRTELDATHASFHALLDSLT